jgi:hypothetical protein
MLQNAVMPPACASLGTLHPNHRSLPARPTLSLSLPLLDFAVAGPRRIHGRVASPPATTCSPLATAPADRAATRRPTPPARSGQAERSSLAAAEIPMRARRSKGKGRRRSRRDPATRGGSSSGRRCGGSSSGRRRGGSISGHRQRPLAD